MLKEYMIPLKGLKDGEHDYEYAIDTSFFQEFECETILEADLKANIKITRRESHCDIGFEIQGTLAVPCDRCLDPVRIPSKVQERLIVKFGHEYEEINEELIVIPEKEGVLNISQYIYEYVILSIPSQNKHKKKDCNVEMMQKLQEHQVSIENQVEEQVDPIWAELKDILKNN